MFSIASCIVPSAVAIVFNTTNSSLFKRSIDFILPSFNCSSTFSDIFPAINILFLFDISFMSSSIGIFSSENGALKFSWSFIIGTGPIIISELPTSSVRLAHLFTFGLSINFSEFSSPYVYTKKSSLANNSIKLTTLKSPPIMDTVLYILFSFTF